MNKIMFSINTLLLIGLIVSTDDQNDTKPNVEQQPEPLTFNKSGGLQAATGVQVNSLPHPFNVGGNMPYQVWVNGERLPLNSDKANRIVDLLDLKPFEQPKNTAAIHNGAGWMFPHPTK